MRNGGCNAIVHKLLPLRCLKFNGAIFFDDKEDQSPLATCCHSLSPEGSVCTHSLLCLFSRPACAPAYVEAIPPAGALTSCPVSVSAHERVVLCTLALSGRPQAYSPSPSLR